MVAAPVLHTIPFNFNDVTRFPEVSFAGNKNITISLIMDHQSEENQQVNKDFDICKCCYLYLRVNQVERHLHSREHALNLTGQGRVQGFNWTGVNS